MTSKKVIYTKTELQFCSKEIQDNFVFDFFENVYFDISLHKIRPTQKQQYLKQLKG